MRHAYCAYFYVLCCLCLAVTPAYSTIQTPTQSAIQQPSHLSFKDRFLLKVLQFKVKHFASKSLIFNGMPGDCAKIVLKDGDVIEANIIQISPIEVKYKRCGKPNDPETILYKKDILSIKAADGEIIYRNTGNTTARRTDTPTSNDEASYNGYAIAGFVTGLCGLIVSAFWLGLASAIVGIVLSYMGLKQIKANPSEYKGKGLARAGLILGIIACGLFLLALA